MAEEKRIYTCGSRAGTLQITGQQPKLSPLPEASVSQDFMAAYHDVSLCETACEWEPGQRQALRAGGAEVLKVFGTSHRGEWRVG